MVLLLEWSIWCRWVVMAGWVVVWRGCRASFLGGWAADVGVVSGTGTSSVNIIDWETWCCGFERMWDLAQGVHWLVLRLSIGLRLQDGGVCGLPCRSVRAGCLQLDNSCELSLEAGVDGLEKVTGTTEL